MRMREASFLKFDGVDIGDGLSEYMFVKQVIDQSLQLELENSREDIRMIGCTGAGRNI
jgi:hypothetical protein